MRQGGFFGHMNGGGGIILKVHVLSGPLSSTTVPGGSHASKVCAIHAWSGFCLFPVFCLERVFRAHTVWHCFSFWNSFSLL